MSLPQVALWPTDVLFFLVLAMTVLYARSAAADPLARARWARVFHRPSAAAAALVLGVYLSLAVLDSMRLMYDGQTRSALDWLCSPLLARVEATYSAPFAAFGYMKETVRNADGTTIRAYPRLRHGASHLEQPAREKAKDLWWRTLLGLGGGAGVVAFILGGLAYRSRHGLGTFVREARARKAPLITAAMIILVGGVVIALAPHYHLFGTDKVGNDVFYLALKSARTAIVFALISSALTLPIAALLGLCAGYFGGIVDDVVQFLYTSMASIPGVLLIAAAVLSLDVALQTSVVGEASPALRADYKLAALCVVLGLTGWTGLCRLLRAEALKLRQIEFVLAAKSMGSGTLAILCRHLLPNTVHLVIITLVLDFSGLVLAEAVLTYIDIGVDPSMESWGNMINGARLELAREPVVWWSLGAAFVSMFGLVLATNIVADAVRDEFDPRTALRHQG